MKNTLYVHGYGNGGPHSYETFRVAWSALGDADKIDMRCREWRALASQGLCGAVMVRGAYARDAAVEHAQAALAAVRVAS